MEIFFSILLYTFIFAFTPVFVLVSEKSKVKFLGRLLPYLILLLPALLAMVRYKVGTDYDSYYRIFTYCKDYDWPSIFSLKVYPKEIFFKLIIKLFSFCSNYELFGLFAYFTLFPILYTLKKYYINPFIISTALFIYLIWYFPDSFNILRQAFACSIVFMAIHELTQGNKNKFILLIFIAGLIHVTALTNLIVLLIWDSKKSKTINDKWFYCFCFFFIFILLYWSDVLNLIGIPLFKNYSIRAAGSNSTFYLKFCLAIFFWIYKKKLICINRNNELFLKLQQLSVFIALCSFKTPYLLRLSLYFEYTNIVLLAYTTIVSKNFKNYFVYIFIILLCFLYYFGIQCGLLLGKNSSYLPFHFIPM